MEEAEPASLAVFVFGVVVTIGGTALDTFDAVPGWLQVVGRILAVAGGLIASSQVAAWSARRKAVKPPR